MITIIRANRYQLYGKILLHLFCLGMLAAFTFFLWPFKGNQWFAPILLIAATILFGVQTFFLPIRVILNDASKEIKLHFLLRNSKLISIEDISSYGTTLIVTRSSNYEGLLLHLNNNKELLLSDFSLKDYKPIKLLLEQSNVPFNNKEAFKAFAYYRNCI